MQLNQLSGQVKVFYSDGFKIGMEIVEEGISVESILKSTTKIYENIDALNDAVLSLAEKENTTVFCKKGCFLCCYQPVYALTHEVIYLKEFIKTNFPEAEIRKIYNRARDKELKTGKLNEENLLNSKYPCPLLVDGACSAYKARPMACRIYLSLSFKSCEKFYEYPEDKTGFPQIMHFPLQAGRMMNEGYKAALKQAGWKSQEFRIEEGLLSKIFI
ncbi:MAG: YkgJ family cysteine cluster protein [Prolixibacteraceae bacterium]|nr:YkgJ family cysteine cluster protein [Prolixibacteraceae bacterium]